MTLVYIIVTSSVKRITHIYRMTLVASDNFGTKIKSYSTSLDIEDYDWVQNHFLKNNLILIWKYKNEFCKEQL